MKTYRYTRENAATAQASHPGGLTTWTRSMPFMEMMRAAAIALNEALILAYYIFGH
jgi:hypothetical protein